MRSACLGLLLFMVFFQASLAWGNSSILTFKEWKNGKITPVRQEYALLESHYLTKKSINPQDKSLPNLYRKLKNLKSHLDELMALDVTDYFISYLSEYKDKKAVFDAAISRLEPSEVSEVMGAYANSLLKTNGIGLSTSADLPKESASK